jgi:ATP-dependent Clp protease ATP-binding subunit ClpA/CheY-like chemotaxis protein
VDERRESSAPEKRQPVDLVALLSRKVVGQTSALEYIIPTIQMYQAGLNPPDRPAGVFLLLGPTGTGKTRTVEALAEILHGDAKRLLKIDCAEFQTDHEVAKLLGAPPGYVGHRETKPLLTQERLLDTVSANSDLALVLFDEIEKAAPALTTLLLGVLDKATLRLGDGGTVNFENAVIFLTSNLGARDMVKEIQPEIGFQRGLERRSAADLAGRLEQIGLAAVRKRFSPEFVNRIDAVITYRPLNAESLAQILDAHIAELQKHVHTRLGERSFEIEVSQPARDLMLEKGVSAEYGARELKRTIHRLLTQPLAALVADGLVGSGGKVHVEVSSTDGSLALRVENRAVEPEQPPAAPAVLILDDNVQLASWLQRELARTGITSLAAATAKEAREIASRQAFDFVIADLLLPDGDGLSVAFELLRMWPRVRIVVMTGSELSPDELAVCERQDFPVLRKPFLAADVISLVRAGLLRSTASG